MTKKAIIHVENNTNLLDLVSYLVSSGWTLLSANKTEEYLQKERIPVVHESALMENNQYVSETSRLMQQLLSTREFDSEVSGELDDSGIFLICMNLIPRYYSDVSEKDHKTVFKPEKHYYSNIIRNAVSNYSNILILTDPADYKEAMIQLKVGSVTNEFRAYLAAKALNLISAYDASIAGSILGSRLYNIDFTNYLSMPYVKDKDLVCGANAQQKAAVYCQIGESPEDFDFQRLQGADPDYNTIKDVSYAWEQVCSLFDTLKNQMTVKSINCDGYEFTTQFTPITGTVFTLAVKHNTVLGAALAPNVLESFKNTYSYNVDEISDAVLASSSVINEEAAVEIVKANFKAIIAPGFTTEARQVFSVNRNTRLVSNVKILKEQLEYTTVPGGMLVQTKEKFLFETWHVRTKNRPSQYKTDEMAFGMVIAMHSRTNCAVLIKQNAVIGIAQSCTYTRNAIRNVIFEALDYNSRHASTDNPDIDNTLADILVCDFPIPFCDEIKELMEKGITAIIQPGGTVNDSEFIQYCDERGIVMVFTGMSHLSY